MIKTIEERYEELAMDPTYKCFLNRLVEIHVPRGLGAARGVVLAASELLCGGDSAAANDLLMSVREVVSSDPTFESFFRRVVEVHDSDPKTSTKYMMECLVEGLRILNERHANAPAIAA
jgi:hypothetical protein